MICVGYTIIYDCVRYTIIYDLWQVYNNLLFYLISFNKDQVYFLISTILLIFYKKSMSSYLQSDRKNTPMEQTIKNEITKFDTSITTSNKYLGVGTAASKT